jgi:hypothetical protein
VDYENGYDDGQHAFNKSPCDEIMAATIRNPEWSNDDQHAVHENGSDNGPNKSDDGHKSWIVLAQ